MTDAMEMKIVAGSVYESANLDGDNSKFIVTGIGLNHILFADYPMIKFNGSYLEYCVTRKEFRCKFKASSSNAA